MGIQVSPAGRRHPGGRVKAVVLCQAPWFTMLGMGEYELKNQDAATLCGCGLGSSP